MNASDLTAVLLFLAAGLRVALVLGALWLIVPKRRLCPHCGGATLRMVTPAWLRKLRVERHGCVCGWAGFVKIMPMPRVLPHRHLTDRWFRRVKVR